MNTIKRWYRTLELAAHCLCEQGYDATNLIEIAKYIESSSGIKPNPVVDEILKTISFHEMLERREREEESAKRKEEKRIRRYDQLFRELPDDVRVEMIRQHNGNYWKAVESYVMTRKRRTDKCIVQK
jgi:hypothetical protein